MTVWIIEPRDPLIVRDGRPFGPDPGARSVSMSFPLPSTLVGGLRAQVGPNEKGVWDVAHLQANVTIRGPLLVEIHADDQLSWLLPAPADALLLSPEEADGLPKGALILKRLLPLVLPGGAHSNLPRRDGSATRTVPQLEPVGQPVYRSRKPYDGPDAPRFWRWDKLLSWLSQPADESQARPADLGLRGPLLERRTHVRVDPQTLTASEGFLFQTAGLEFTHVERADGAQRPRLSTARRLALAVLSETGFTDRLAPLGGERRLMRWWTAQGDQADWLTRCPDAIAKAIIEQRACRVLLATPAYFAQGSFPGAGLLGAHGGAQPGLRAMCLPSAQTTSGWDLATQRARPSRRLAPAGSVYFLKLPDSWDAQTIRTWIDTVWMQCVSDAGQAWRASADDGKPILDEDDGQASRDGFGLALLGTWDGLTRPLTIVKEQP